ncbi:hypothetical protein KQI88_15655 [Alkaliphilus sp. MSJ-5]|uniref:Phage late control gene D protein (GPD) n=1 Tax=Alkaliphilus flagellatus TaxID=2841507 RepID=A0ABS6G660_9FIRM|nr:contractile injection system protein, VgrG/Pvc8 family [Alkaliphilus flagellatus]MBU5677853.1 hypothetical protein [Alkaliphilus flagellatus]
MKEKGITYQELRLSISSILYIKTLRITENINNHATMKVSAMLTDDMKEEIIHEAEMNVSLYYIEEGTSHTLFTGRVTKLDLTIEGDLYQLEIEANSYTYDMDINKRSRSFQDINMLSHEVIKSVMKHYKDSDCLLKIPNEPIGQLVVQYEETDWQFIKRFVSRYNEGLYPEASFSQLRYYIGVPPTEQEVNWDHLPYTISKNIKDYSCMKKNALPMIKEVDYVVYRVQAYDYAPLGATIVYQKKNFTISKIQRELIDGQLMSTYQIQLKNGLLQPKIYNEAITGVSIDGNIIEVSRNKVKAQLAVDEVQEKKKAYWFPYATMSASKDGSGWHCMPEIGESIRAYFPTHDEKEGYVITNIKAHRPDTPSKEDSMSNPTNKSLSTPHNKAVHFTEEGVLIIADDGAGQVLLGIDGTVTVSGVEKISLNANEDITIRAEKEIVLTADNIVDLLCEKDGQIQILPGGTMNIKSKEIIEN